jgi:hypothetical protein
LVQRFLVAGTHPSRTWASGSFKSVYDRMRVTQTRPRFNVPSEWREHHQPQVIGRLIREKMSLPLPGLEPGSPALEMSVLTTPPLARSCLDLIDPRWTLGNCIPHRGNTWYLYQRNVQLLLMLNFVFSQEEPWHGTVTVDVEFCFQSRRAMTWRSTVSVSPPWNKCFSTLPSYSYRLGRALLPLVLKWSQSRASRCAISHLGLKSLRALSSRSYVSYHETSI